MSSATSSEGVVILSGLWRQRAAVSGVASPWRKSGMSRCTGGLGTPRHVPTGRTALMKWGRKSGRRNVFCYQFGGGSNTVGPLAPKSGGVWRCLAVEKVRHVEVHRGTGDTEARADRQNCIDEVGTKVRPPECLLLPVRRG